MARDYQRQLRQAIYTALTADSAITTLVGSRIYQSQAAPDAVYPLIVIGAFIGSDEATKCGSGMSATIDISIFNEAKKSSAIQTTLQIGEAIDAVLDEAALAVTGYDVIELYLSSTRGPMHDPEPDIAHLFKVYRVLAFPN